MPTCFGNEAPFAHERCDPDNARMTLRAVPRFLPVLLLATMLPVTAHAADAAPTRAELVASITAAMRDAGAQAAITELVGRVVIERNPATWKKLDDPAQKKVAAALQQSVATELARSGAFDALVAHQLEFVNDEALAALARVLASADGKVAAAVLMQLPQRLANDAAARLQPEYERAVEAATGERAHLAKLRQAAREIAAISGGLLFLVRDDDDPTKTVKYPDGPLDRVAALVARSYGALPAVDPWQQRYVYVVTPDRLHYRIVSGGADGKIDPASLDFARAPEDQASLDPNADLVLQDGAFIGAPRGVADAPEGED